MIKGLRFFAAFFVRCIFEDCQELRKSVFFRLCAITTARIVWTAIVLSDTKFFCNQ